LEIRRDQPQHQPAGRSNLSVHDERLIAYFGSLGATTEIVRLAEYERPAISARGIVERLRARVSSADWDTPDALHDEALRQLEEWFSHAIAAPNEPVAIVGNFTAIAANWRS
jgi:hypothetical protein